MVSCVLAVHNEESLHATIGFIILAWSDSVNDMLGVLHSLSCSCGSQYVDLYHFVSLGVSLEIRSAVETFPA